MVPGAGIEPARRLSRGILSPLCLPVSPPGLGWARNAARWHCITTELEAGVGIEPA